MMRRSLMRAAAVAAGAFLLWGGSSLRAAEAAPAASLSPFAATDTVPLVGAATVGPTVGSTIGATINPALAPAMVNPAAGSLATSIGVDTGEPLAANATDGVAAIPLPPSAYPGMVGLATAALSVWRYRRRRR
jgi:hypothetical protein